MTSSVAADVHSFRRALLALPYFEASARGLLPARSELGCLRALVVILGALEHQLARVTDPAAARQRAGVAHRLAEARRELLRVDDDVSPEHPDPAEVALEIADLLRTAADDAPGELEGYRAAIEAATDAAWAHRAPASPAPPAPEVGDDASAAAGVRAACPPLLALFRALHPLDDRRLAHSLAAINPEAGVHTIPSDAREVHAALRAAERCLLALPYFDLRFGERGRRFTRSDSAWLASLVGEAGVPPALFRRQIAWLGRLLAVRGIPRWTLEIHLRLLHEELAAAVPARARGYAPLLEGAAELAAARQARVPDAVVEKHARALAAVAPAVSREIPEAPWLVASAVADELDGIARARAAVMDWLADPARFPPASGAALRAFEAALVTAAAKG